MRRPTLFVSGLAVVTWACDSGEPAAGSSQTYGFPSIVGPPPLSDSVAEALDAVSYVQVEPGAVAA